MQPVTDKYDAIRDNVMQLLTAAAVTYRVRYVGETARETKGDAKPWPCDAWRFTFKGAGKDAEYSGDYFTGIGRRKPKGGAPADKGHPNTLYREDWEKQRLKPVSPPAADILHSLLLDATAEEQNFRDWAADLGYSDDSISALETYRECCDIGPKLRKVFTREHLDALRTATEEL